MKPKPLIKHSITICLITIITISCSHKHYPSSAVETETTIVEKEIIKDTIIKVEPDSSIIKALIKCDSTGRAHLQELQTLKESIRVQQSVSIETNPKPHQPTAITINTKIDSLGIYLKYKERYKQETKTKTIEKTVIKETNIIKPYQKLLMRVGAISIAALILYIIWKLKKFLP